MTLASILALSLGITGVSRAERMKNNTPSLFPTNLPGAKWVQFRAKGFTSPVSGVIYRLQDHVTNGMALGGIDTGCQDLATSGLLGYCTLFNTIIPRRGPLNLPILGLSVGGKTWVLCDPKKIEYGEGGYQPSTPGTPYRIWRGNGYVDTKAPFLPTRSHLDLKGVSTPSQIYYWGHYPVADMEFETDAPVSVGLRAWSPFLPGDLKASTLPGIIFEVHLHNTTPKTQKGTLAFSFPGPLPQEAGSDQFKRTELHGGFNGVEVSSPDASYCLGVIGKESLRLGGGLGAEAGAWLKIAKQLPESTSNQAGSSAVVDFTLRPGGSKVVRYVLTWYAPTWNAGGYNWAGAPHRFTHMYARYYPSASDAAQTLARWHTSLLRRVLAWQQVIYTDQHLPIWLRDSLINILYLIPEDGMWAQKQKNLLNWVRADSGLFGLNECPRGCPQIECIPCSFYGNQPLVYFFPQLALSTLRGYKHYQYPDGAAVWIFGGCTGNTPPIDFANPTKGYQFTTNGISLATMVDRYWLCYGQKDKEFLKEFYPIVKQNLIYTVNLRPAYPIGERIIAMPTGNVGTEWFEAPAPGWAGMVTHVGGLHLAQILIAERMAKAIGDTAFAKQCRDWFKAGSAALESKLWAGDYYLNYWEPETGKISDLVFANQLDGEWVARQEDLPNIFPPDRTAKTLDTILRCNIAVTKYGAANYANPNGSPAVGVGGYGTYAYFPPEALMLAMTYIYNGEKEIGLDLAHKVWYSIVCQKGNTWDQPNIVLGDSGNVTYGWDYYQNMMLWSLPAALEGEDFAAPTKPGGLVYRVLQAAAGRINQTHLTRPNSLTVGERKR